MGPLFDRREGWEFHRSLGENYRSVVHLKGLFGASVFSVWCGQKSNLIEAAERRAVRLRPCRLIASAFER